MATSISTRRGAASASSNWSSLATMLPLKEIGLVCLLSASLFILMSLFSHHPEDPSFSFSGYGSQVHNLGGVSGAYLSDLAFYLFGAMAWLLPLAFLIGGLRLVFGAPLEVPGLGALVRVVGWAGCLICGVVLLQLHVNPEGASATYPAGVGGVLGQWLVQQSVTTFGWVGLSVLALSGLLIGAQAATGFSWLQVAEWIGRGCYVVAQLCAAGWHQARAHFYQWQDRRDLVRLQKAQQVKESERAVAQATPAIFGDAVTADTGAPKALPSAQAKADKKNISAKEPRILPKLAERPNRKAAQKRLFDTRAPGELPDLDLLDEKSTEENVGYSADSLQAMSRLLELKLADFGVEATVESVLPGPVVTRFEVQPAAGVKVQKISALAKDLARSMAVISVRIVEVIPGKSVVGIEIPNEKREMVRLREVIASDAFQNSSSPMTLALGKDIAGASICADVAKMPHLLVAGTTGSGKSVGVNGMLLSMLYKSTPAEVRLILVDPKMLELSIYEGIPHLLAPVVTDMKEAAHALNWCVGEMERRYKLMAALGVRNLAGFNKQINEARERGEPLLDPLWRTEDSLDETAPELENLPNIVVVIDEFADMMMMVGKKVEQLIARIAQKARAAGIHLILATQRPSVDVITGLIKANIPTRMGFQVSSKVDSRTILDQGGAEQLLGHGDMLYLPPGTALPQRVHGAFVSDDEVHRVVQDWKLRGEPDYHEEILAGEVEGEPFVQLDGGDDTEQDDELYDEAVQFVLESRRASISAVQRKLRIGYNRAARLIEAMEAAGLVTPMNSNGSREVVVPKRE